MLRSSSGLAGIYGAPVLLTEGKTLSSQTKSLIEKLYPMRVYIAGGTFAVSEDVEKEIKALTKKQNAAVQRLSGNNSVETSIALALAGKGDWSDDKTAIIATNSSFKDALSVAPIAYSKMYPILLSDGGKSVSDKVVDALKEMGITNVIIVGGEGAVSKSVETKLVSAGIKLKTRLGGKNGAETSKLIAQWGIKNGLSADKMGVATSQNFPDALAGAAFCGNNNAVLVLADDNAMDNTSFPKTYKSTIKTGYIFGGEFAVGVKTWNALVASVK